MLPPSSIQDSSKNYIREKLQAIERSHKIRIVLAIESGSRAWGFPSLDSDYDVRFIYAHSVDDYISIVNHRDVIEPPTLHDAILKVPLDINGWDIRKALQLALKSNSVLIEWLVSPIVYIRDHQSTQDLYNFVQKTVDLSYMIYHYQKLVRSTWLRIQQAATVKLYCYAIRASIVIKWINQHHKMPPMDMISLCRTMDYDVDFYNALIKLITTKAQASEIDVMPRNEYFDDIITSVLNDDKVQPRIEHENLPALINSATQLFHKIIGYDPSDCTVKL